MLLMLYLRNLCLAQGYKDFSPVFSKSFLVWNFSLWSIFGSMLAFHWWSFKDWGRSRQWNSAWYPGVSLVTVNSAPPEGSHTGGCVLGSDIKCPEFGSVSHALYGNGGGYWMHSFPAKWTDSSKVKTDARTLVLDFRAEPGSSNMALS